MDRVYNFSAGPSVLPVEVLEQAQKEMVNYNGSGMSVMEMSHRSKVYDEIIVSAKEGLRKLMNISDEYEVLFMQGGASSQFACVPMNLSRGGKCLYVNSGAFSTKAIAEAKRYADVEVIASSKEDNFQYIPAIGEIPQDASYLHLTTNNTIFGTSFHSIPDAGNVTLVSDMSSEICGVERDVNQYGLIYAGAQKNLGPAGMTVVIVRKDLLGHELGITPAMFNYATMAKAASMYNTPATYSIYVAKLNFDYMLRNGGVAGAQQRNEEKARVLYEMIDNSKLYNGVAREDSRSIMNVTFTLPDADMTAEFIAGAAKVGLLNLKGHRSVGGCRASIYNAMTIEGINALVGYMKEFESSRI